MKISKTSYAITGLGAIPPWVVNAGFIVGQQKTLIIDTGMNRLAAQTIHGYATAVRPQNELLVFNCEPHFDHIGGNGYFRDLGIDIYGHPSIQRTSAELVAEKEEYNQSIPNAVRRAKRETNAFFMGTDIVNPNHEALAGHIFDLGGVEAEVLATPGHTSINQSIYNRTDKVLFCADCIVTGYLPNLETGTIEDWRSWLLSLARIEALSPNVIVPGHGNVMAKDQIASEIARIAAIVEAAISSGKPPTI